jgi:hypothetical protein
LSLDDPDPIPAMLEGKLAQRGDESFHQLEALASPHVEAQDCRR